MLTTSNASDEMAEDALLEDIEGESPALVDSTLYGLATGCPSTPPSLPPPSSSSSSSSSSSHLLADPLLFPDVDDEFPDDSASLLPPLPSLPSPPPLPPPLPLPLCRRATSNTDNSIVSPRYITSYRERNCFHSTMTRQQIAPGDDTCIVCRRSPFLNWLYLCTEDATDYYAERNAVEDRFLSPWISKAVAEGCYTEDQIRVLVLQKLDVRELCEMERRPIPVRVPEDSQMDTVAAAVNQGSNRNTDNDHGESLAESTEDNYDNSKEEAAFEQQQQQSEHDHHPSTQPIEPSEQFLYIPPTSLPCNFKFCHSCRPNFHERAWASIDAVCTHELRKPTFLHLCTATQQSNRRVSDVNVVRTLGIRRLIQPVSPILGESSGGSGGSGGTQHRHHHHAHHPTSQAGEAGTGSSTNSSSDDDAT